MATITRLSYGYYTSSINQQILFQHEHAMDEKSLGCIWNKKQAFGDWAKNFIKKPDR